MTKQTKPIPSLRFPEFDGEWSSVNLSEIGRVIRGSSPRPQGDKRYYGGNVPRLMVADVTRDGKYVTPKVDFLTEAGAKLSRPCKAGTLTIVCSGTVGIPSILAVDACIHDGFIALVDINDNFSIDYIYHQLTTLRDRFEKSATHGGIFTNLTTLEMKEFAVAVTSLPEQRKIAAFLTAVDESIDYFAKKKDLLEKYKKGVMKMLFSQEVRFKHDNGNDYPDWEERRIGDLTSVTAGATPSTVQSDYWNGDIRWMNSGELNLKRVYEVENRITQLGLESSSTRMLPKYCVLIGLAGQGKTRGTVAMNMVELCTNQSIAAIHPSEDLVEDFIYHNLDSRYDELRSLSTGDGGRGGLNLQIIKALKINLPSVPEQEKIAAFISSLDSNIALINQRRGKTKVFKKALLQQMFV